MPEVTTSYLICATPRSGSTLLCERLWLSKLAGHPNEWMLPDTREQAEQMFGVVTPFHDPAFLGEIVTKTSIPNGVFGAKLMWPTMHTFLRGELWNFKLAGSALRNSAVLPNVHYIRIARRDKLRQAISYFMAQKTDYWHKLSPDEEAGPRWPLAALREDLGDPARRSALLVEIAARLEEIRWQDRAWEHFFSDVGIAPLDVDYDALVADPHGTTCRTLEFLGVPIDTPVDFTGGRMHSLSDERNELLVVAYENDAGPERGLSRPV